MAIWRKLLILLAPAAFAATASAAAPALNPGKADLADLTLQAPVIVRAEIAGASKISAKLAPGVAPGFRRLLVEANISNVLIAPGYVPAAFEYLVDLPLDSRGRTPKLKGLPVLLFVESGRAENQYRLVRPWAQVDWTPDRDAYVRALAAEAMHPNLAGLSVTGFGQAFHVPGSLPGEAESQIFVQTASGRPVSLVVLSRPGQQRAFSVAVGDVIDEAASEVRPGSLLWYHLACGLPADLPETSTETLDADNAAAVRDDYRFVRESLSPCDRAFSE